jgi:hypothetical protein
MTTTETRSAKVNGPAVFTRITAAGFPTPKPGHGLYTLIAQVGEERVNLRFATWNERVMWLVHNTVSPEPLAVILEASRRPESPGIWSVDTCPTHPDWVLEPILIGEMAQQCRACIADHDASTAH